MKNQRKYEREFKINAAKLYRESGKSMAYMAQDLGVPLTTLAQWIQQFKEHGEEGFPGSGSLMPCNEELVRLRRELADVRQERDILKKAVAIFSKAKG